MRDGAWRGSLLPSFALDVMVEDEVQQGPPPGGLGRQEAAEGCIAFFSRVSGHLLFIRTSCLEWRGWRGGLIGGIRPGSSWLTPRLGACPGLCEIVVRIFVSDGNCSSSSCTSSCTTTSSVHTEAAGASWLLAPPRWFMLPKEALLGLGSWRAHISGIYSRLFFTLLTVDRWTYRPNITVLIINNLQTSNVAASRGSRTAALQRWGRCYVPHHVRLPHCKTPIRATAGGDWPPLRGSREAHVRLQPSIRNYTLSSPGPGTLRPGTSLPRIFAFALLSCSAPRCIPAEQTERPRTINRLDDADPHSLRTLRRSLDRGPDTDSSAPRLTRTSRRLPLK